MTLDEVYERYAGGRGAGPIRMTWAEWLNVKHAVTSSTHPPPGWGTDPRLGHTLLLGRPVVIVTTWRERRVAWLHWWRSRPGGRVTP